MSRYPLLAASALALALALFLTWPQALQMGSAVAMHNDAYFSMWRLGWIAHALRTHPAHFYDANIYYPETGTLAYSDAILLEGALGAPLLWAGLSPVLVYNVLLLTGTAGSGLAMFVLVRYLTGNVGSALVSAAVFTLAPYRVEHFMHLELQWSMWMPLAFWATHRAVEEESWRFGVLAGLFVWLQMLSCVYYSVFLGIMLGLLGTLLVATTPRRRLTGLASLAVGGLLAACLALPYARVYADTARRLGPRDIGEVATYSAHWLSYATAPYQNWLWGWSAGRFAGEELRVMPGVAALLLAALGLFGRRSRMVWIYAALCAVAVELSLGLNGSLYGWLLNHVSTLGGLRAIARFSLLADACLAVLAGFGVSWLQTRCRSTHQREWVAAVAIIALTLECGSAPMWLESVPHDPPSVYQVLRQLPDGVVAEFPMPEPGWIPGFDPHYQYWSMVHWKKLVNGYSGYASTRYAAMLRTMLTFPDDGSIERLRNLDVRYVVIHEKLYERDADYRALLITLAARQELQPMGRYHDWIGSAELFLLR